MNALPALHPGDMAECTCNTGAEHGAAVAASHAAWSAAYDALTTPADPIQLAEIAE